MKMTSGFNFEGYKIIEYCGVYSGECALGTGYFSNLDAKISDVFGMESTAYAEKLKKAKEFSMNQLVKKVEETGANAIIGLDIDYTTFSSDIMGVITSGTAVKIEPIMFPQTQLNVTNYNPDLKFRPVSLSILSSEKHHALCLVLSGESVNTITAVLSDISLITIFEDEIMFKNLAFTNFSSIEGENEYKSSHTIYSIPLDILPLIKSAKVFIRKYISDNTIVTATNNDSIWVSKKERDVAQAISQGLNIDTYISAISFLDSAKEILDYTQKLNGDHDNFLSSDLLELISSFANLERMYGNSKEGCINKIKQYFTS